MSYSICKMEFNPFLNNMDEWARKEDVDEE
jgi:hypothetical protein